MMRMTPAGQRVYYQRALTVWIMWMMVTGGFLGFLLNESEPVSAEGSYTLRGPIRINGDGEFTAGNGVSDGDGSPGTPYIIEGWEINGSGLDNCIYIGNTTAHFIVRNCYLHHASGENKPYYLEDGLLLYNVQNGLITNNIVSSNEGRGIDISYCYSNIITNNTATYNSIGVRFVFSHNITALNNTLSDNDYGFSLYESFDNTISNNTAIDNSEGVSLVLADSNTIDNNTLSLNVNSGIYLQDSSNTTIVDNTMVNNSIVIHGSSLEYWNTHTIDTSNTVNNKPVYYWANVTSGTIPTDAGQVILANCNNVFVENLSLSNVSVGVSLGYSSNNIIRNNSASFGHIGIHLSYSDSNTITDNLVTSNKNYGMYLNSSSSNTIDHNDFVSNTNQAYDDTGMNSWDNGTEGNYWSDYRTKYPNANRIF